MLQIVVGKAVWKTQNTVVVDVIVVDVIVDVVVDIVDVIVVVDAVFGSLRVVVGAILRFIRLRHSGFFGSLEG